MNFAWIKAKRFHLILTLIMLLAFSGFTLLFVINRGICCADDAWYAVVAKNLASGRGYTSTLQNGPPVFRSIAFDPTVGTGPTSIFPAALFIKIFGNTYWAPGLSHVVLVTGLLALIGNRVYKWLGCSALPQMAGSFFFLNYALLAYHFTH